MRLYDVLARLEWEDPTHRVQWGWGRGSACSYRGFYSELAFRLIPTSTVGAMLQEARDAVGATFEGYKGDTFTMNLHSECYVVPDQSYSGDDTSITELVLSTILGKPPVWPPTTWRAEVDSIWEGTQAEDWYNLYRVE